MPCWLQPGCSPVAARLQLGCSSVAARWQLYMVETNHIVVPHPSKMSLPIYMSAWQLGRLDMTSLDPSMRAPHGEAGALKAASGALRDVLRERRPSMLDDTELAELQVCSDMCLDMCLDMLNNTELAELQT